MISWTWTFKRGQYLKYWWPNKFFDIKYVIYGKNFFWPWTPFVLAISQVLVAKKIFRQKICDLQAKIAIGSNKICDAAIISVISLFDLEPHVSQVRLVKKKFKYQNNYFWPKITPGSKVQGLTPKKNVSQSEPLFMPGDVIILTFICTEIAKKW